MKKRIFGFIFVLVLFFLFLIAASFVSAEKYTREESEELFHANLINWQEYGQEVFDKALKENKPIYLVLSADAWCYWCHVYESKDFLYHDALYPFIDKEFVPVYVDADQRADLTRQYLEGGWPSTTILAPDGKRIQGFTGPRDPEQLKNFLERVVALVKSKQFLQPSYDLGYEEKQPRIPDNNIVDAFLKNYPAYALQNYDSVYGGFGFTNQPPEWREGQKFPRGYTHTYLLEEYIRTRDPQYLGITNFTFYQQYTRLSELETNYRLFDPVEGGFHRYSTRRDWTIPHYEKLLKDQARLLEAYSFLAGITDDKTVRAAVTFSFGFLQNRFLDNETGAFYNSQDAYIEGEYFGKTAEERALIKPPYIDKTLFADSNAQIIMALISASHFLQNSTYRDWANAGLDFFTENMVSGKGGAYFYFDFEKKKPEVTGQSFANSWLLLAFVRGYEEFNDTAYLSAAEKVARFSLGNLYDWNSGGFFERHSAEDELYGPNQRVLLSKPYEENAVFAYGILKLYTLTGKPEYLNAGLKTFGYFEDSFGGLDESYYFVKSAQLIKERGFISDYLGRSSEISLVEKAGKENFFLPKLLEAQKAGKPLPSESLVVPALEDKQLANANFAALALLAFLAGLVSFLSPCTLPILPAFFASAVESGRAAHTSNAHHPKPKKTRIAANTLLFIAGLAVVFAVFGMGATLFGTVLREHRVAFSAAAGAVVITLGLLQILGKGFSGPRLFSGKAPGRAGFVFFGMAFGLGWSACIGPVLASLLLLAASSATVLKGMLLLFIYISGLALPLLLLSLLFERIKNQKLWQWLNGSPVTIVVFNKRIETHTTYILSGFLLIIMGFLIFNGYLYGLNKFALSTGYVQKIVIGAEEWLKGVFL